MVRTRLRCSNLLVSQARRLGSLPADAQSQRKVSNTLVISPELDPASQSRPAQQPKMTDGGRKAGAPQAAERLLRELEALHEAGVLHHQRRQRAAAS